MKPLLATSLGIAGGGRADKRRRTAGREQAAAEHRRRRRIRSRLGILDSIVGRRAVNSGCRCFHEGRHPVRRRRGHLDGSIRSARHEILRRHGRLNAGSRSGRHLAGSTRRRR